MNIGLTVITVTGDPAARAALHALAASTAQLPDFGFTLHGILGGDAKDTSPCRWTELHQQDDEIVFVVSIDRDGNCLGAARILSRRYPTLSVHAIFRAESDRFEASAMGFSNGETLYSIRFDEPVVLYSDPSAEKTGYIIQVHQRSRWADVVALNYLGTCGLACLSRQPVPPNGWHQVSQAEDPDLFFRPGVGDEDATAILVADNSITLLSEVNLRGGYKTSRVVDADVGSILHPEVWPQVAQAIEKRRQVAVGDNGAAATGDPGLEGSPPSLPLWSGCSPDDDLIEF